MAVKLIFAILFAQYSLVTSFVVTSYYEAVATTNSDEFGPFTETFTLTVLPTGPATGTYTFTTIFSYPVQGGVLVPITYESILLPTNAAAATIEPFNHTTIGVPQSPTPSVNIFTNYYGPAIVTPPDSCTLTKFSYTAAESVDLPTEVLSLITPVSITTYILTESTDLGNQVTTTYQCDIYLSVGLLPSLSPAYEYDLLTQCVDPRRWDCYPSSVARTGGCPTHSPPYPTGSEGAVTKTQPSGATAATTGISGQATTAAKTGGAGSLSLRMMGENLIIPIIVMSVLVV